MGQLLLDGVPIGVPDRSVTAGGVSYDNTQSGLSATDVQGAVDEIVTDTYSLFVIEEKTVWPNMTLSANSAMAVKTADLSKIGYKPIGIVGFRFDGSNGNCLSYSKLSISANTLTYLIANNGNTSANGVNAIVVVLYARSTS